MMKEGERKKPGKQELGNWQRNRDETAEVGRVLAALVTNPASYGQE